MNNTQKHRLVMIFHAFKRHPFLCFFGAVLIAGGAYFFLSPGGEEVPDTVLVRRGEVSQTVSVTGKVKAAAEANLSFEKSGRVAVVHKKVGERVFAGDALVSLENGAVAGDLGSARASAKAEQAVLDQLNIGAKAEDIAVYEIAVENARTDVSNDIRNGYSSADDAIRNKVDQFFSNPRSSSPQLNFPVGDSQQKIEVESLRVSIEAMLSDWNKKLTLLSFSSDLLYEAEYARNILKSIQTFLDKVAFLVNALSPSGSLSQTTIDTYKSSVSTARSNINTALDSLTSSEEELKNAGSALTQKKAKATKEEIAAEEAKVEAALAKVDSLEAEYKKTVLRSPITGIVTKQEAKVGEIASLGVNIVSVISDAKYEIEANIPEADISKIKVGNSASVTLDAYGSDVVFEAVVSSIDPAETVIDGVSTYKTVLQFKAPDARIRSGMTANTDIAGERRRNVLFLPGRVVATKDGIKTVNVIAGKDTYEVTVTTGLRGSNGDIEILSGLSEGETVKIR